MTSEEEREMARRCEECLIRAWPAVTTLMIEGWAVRFANGYSSRANSASAIATGAGFTDALLGKIEALYREQDLKPRVRVTPVADPSTGPLLAKRGYAPIDASMTMILPLGGRLHGVDARVRLAARPEDPWLAGISARQEASKRSAEHLRAIVSRIRLPAAFATLGDGLGFGLCAVDGDLAELGSIMIDAAHRRQGLGEALVASLLDFARGQGAKTAFLQVDCGNAPAVRLYERLGFRPLYRYNTFRLD